MTTATQTPPDLDTLTEAQPVAARIAREIAHEFAEYITPAQVHQATLAWARQNHERIESCFRVDDDIDLDLGRRRLRRLLHRVARGRAYQAKADYLGFRISDLHFYSLPTIEGLLPLAFDYRNWLPSGRYPPRSIGGRAPATAGAFTAELCDVKAAFLAGSQADQQLLYDRYVIGLDTKTLAATYDIGTSTMNRRINAALWRMVDRLGGPRPIFPRVQPRTYGGSRD